MIHEAKNPYSVKKNSFLARFQAGIHKVRAKSFCVVIPMEKFVKYGKAQ
jgi:hypothetical protein